MVLDKEYWSGAMINEDLLKRFVEDESKAYKNSRGAYEGALNRIKQKLEHHVGVSSYIGMETEVLQTLYANMIEKERFLSRLCAILGGEYQEIYLRICGDSNNN